MTDLVAHIEPYALGDSPEGIALAAMRGYVAVDLNIRTCRYNGPWIIGARRRRIVVAHWDEWWKHGFEPKPGTRVPHKPISKLRLRQVRNLRSIEGHHEIVTAEEAVRLCKRHGVIPFFEMKPSVWVAQTLVNLRNYARELRWPMAFMTIQNLGDAFKRLKLAKSIGGVTVLLYRAPVDWQRWAPVLTGIKGRPGHGPVLGLPATLRKLQREYG